MSKGWRVIGTLVLVLVLLGAICIGVGFMTGGDVAGIYSTINARHHITEYWNQWSQWALTSLNNIWEGVRQLW